MADTKRNNNHLSMKPTRKMLEYEIWTLIDWLPAWRSDDPKTGKTERDWCWLLVLVFVIPPHSPLRPRFFLKRHRRIAHLEEGRQPQSQWSWVIKGNHTYCKTKVQKKETVNVTPLSYSICIRLTDSCGQSSVGLLPPLPTPFPAPVLVSALYRLTSSLQTTFTIPPVTPACDGVLTGANVLKLKSTFESLQPSSVPLCCQHVFFCLSVSVCVCLSFFQGVFLPLWVRHLWWVWRIAMTVGQLLIRARDSCVTLRSAVTAGNPSCVMSMNWGTGLCNHFKEEEES